MKKKRWFLRIVVVLLVAFVAIQFWPVARTNPPVTKPLQASPEVLAVLKRACFDCHSNETVWPWYAYVAPVSWLVAHDVDDGRHELNFSHWGDYSPNKQSSKAGESVEKAQSGEMPLENYLKLHPEAKLTPQDIQILERWADDV